MMRVRPLRFRLDRKHYLHRGLMLGGFGNAPGSKWFHDSGPFDNRGQLTNMDPATDWVVSPELGRWTIPFAGDTAAQYIVPATALSLTGDFTFAVWFYADDFDDQRCLLGKSDDNNMYWEVASTSAVYYRDPSGFVSTGSLSYTLGTWSHMAITRRGTTITYWQDAIPFDTDTLGSVQTFVSNRIGVRGNTADEMDGMLSDLMVFDGVALSGGELEVLANRFDPMLGGLIEPVTRPTYFLPSAPSFDSRKAYILGGGLGCGV